MTKRTKKTKKTGQYKGERPKTRVTKTFRAKLQTNSPKNSINFLLFMLPTLKITEKIIASRKNYNVGSSLDPIKSQELRPLSPFGHPAYYYYFPLETQPPPFLDRHSLPSHHPPGLCQLPKLVDRFTVRKDEWSG